MEVTLSFVGITEFKTLMFFCLAFFLYFTFIDFSDIDAGKIDFFLHDKWTFSKTVDLLGQRFLWCNSFVSGVQPPPRSVGAFVHWCLHSKFVCLFAQLTSCLILHLVPCNGGVLYFQSHCLCSITLHYLIRAKGSVI